MAQALLTEKELTRLRRLRLAGARVVRAAARGERTARQLGSGQEFAAHRAYAQGDDLRRVDWNVYGRLGQLFVKLFEAPGRLRVLLALDDSPTMDFGGANKWLAARRAAAATALVALGGADRVWLGALDGEPRAYEGAAEARLVAALEDLPVAQQPAGMPRAWLQMISDGGADAVLLLVSDLQQLDPPLALLRECTRRGGRAMCLCVHATEELAPTLAGFSRLQPPGFEALKLRVDARVLDSYRTEIERYRAASANAVRATGAGLIDFDSSAPLEPILAALTRNGLLASRRG